MVESGHAIIVEPATRKVKLVRMGSLLAAVAPPGEKPLTHAQTTKAIRRLRAERITLNAPRRQTKTAP